MPSDRIIPDSALGEPLTSETKAFQSEMLVSDSTGALHVGAAPGALFNDNCYVLFEYFSHYDGDTDSWEDIHVTISFCEGYGSGIIYWLTQNGYDQDPYVVVDANEYAITALDSDTFTATVHSTERLLALGWSWTPAYGHSWDPWTTACTGTGTTCKIQVHGSGTMSYSVEDSRTGDPLVDSVQVGAAIPPDVETTGDGDAPLTTDWDSGGTSSGQLTAAESNAIFLAAKASGEWVYTQGCANCSVPHGSPPGPNWEEPVDTAHKYGDCTDFVFTAVRNYLKSSFPYRKISTAMFDSMNTTQLSKHGWVQVDSASVRPGDVVVRTVIGGGGHAGFFTGWAGGGYPLGWADNGKPAYPHLSRVDDSTGTFHFKNLSGYVTKFFRPQLP